MLEKVLADIYHAQLHRYKDKLEFEVTMSFQEFVARNNKTLNRIYTETKNRFPELSHRVPAHMKEINQGILDYIMAAGVQYR